MEAFRNGQPREAAALCEKVLRQDRGHFWAWYVRALSHFQLGRWGEARVGLDACLKARPDFLWARLFRATAHGELGQASLAEEDFEAVLVGARDPALRYLTWTNRSVHWMRGKRRDRWVLAETDLAKAIELQPDGYKAYVNLAWLHRRRGQTEKALDAITTAIKREPSAPELYLVRARLNAQRDREASRHDYREVIRREPHGVPSLRRAIACVELAYLECKDQRHQAALDLCQDALRAWPDYPPAHRQRGHAFLAQERYREGGQEFDLYLRANRKAGGRPDAEAQRARGHVHVVLREHAEAVVAYTEALAHGLDADTLFRRGSSYLVLNSPQKALADFERALQASPNLPDGLRGRAEARLRLGQVAEAAEDAEAALRGMQRGTESCLWGARFYARAFQSLRERPRGKPASAGLAALFPDRAIDLLREALEGLPRENRKELWEKSVESSADLAPLHGFRRYLDLAGAYGKR
jgi:tetratricopeptide (TPR) repeat protein